MLFDDMRNQIHFFGECRAYLKGDRAVPPFRASHMTQVENEFRGVVRYLRTQVLDENRRAPTEDEITGSFSKIEAHNCA